MAQSDSLKMFFSMFVMYLPTILVCLLAVAVTLARWRQAPSAALWALFGFGLVLGLCFISPVGHTLLSKWAMEAGHQGSRMWAFTAFSLFGSLVHAIAYVFLLIAVFSGRRPPGAVPA